MTETNLEKVADGSGVEAITQLAVAAHDMPPCDQTAVILPKGAQVESLEYLYDQPRQLRATFTTERISDFCRYVDAEGKDDTLITVAPDGSGAQAIIDYGNHEEPCWGHHRALLHMRRTPEFEALKSACGRGTDQRALIEFLEDWRHRIQPYVMSESKPDSATTLPFSSALARIRKIDVKRMLDRGSEEGEWGAKKSTFASVEAVSGSDRPPAGFYFNCQPYPDCEERAIDVRLSIRTTNDDPVLLMRIVGATALDRDIAEEIELDITQRLEGKRVFIGSAKTAYE